MARSMAEVKSNLWYTRRNGQVRGPYPAGQVTRYILLGRILTDDELSQDQQEWVPVADCEALIPEEMKHLETEEDMERLFAARLREDERSGEDRRATQRMVPPEGVNRRSKERRRPEDPQWIAFRRKRLLAIDETERSAPSFIRNTYWLVIFIILGLVVFIMSPDQTVTTSDCVANAEPGVVWNNCKRPGLQAERADLTGAQARNMDLTGAQLGGTIWMQADLAYSLLNLADLRRASLQQANLKGAGLKKADLRSADLSGADLSYADLRGANIAGARFDGARLDHALWIDGRECGVGSVGKCL